MKNLKHKKEKHKHFHFICVRGIHSKMYLDAIITLRSFPLFLSIYLLLYYSIFLSHFIYFSYTIQEQIKMNHRLLFIFFLAAHLSFFVLQHNYITIIIVVILIRKTMGQDAKAKLKMKVYFLFFVLFLFLSCSCEYLTQYIHPSLSKLKSYLSTQRVYIHSIYIINKIDN